MRRVILSDDPFVDYSNLWKRGEWPAKWIRHPHAGLEKPSVTAFRRAFSIAGAKTIRIHVTADERYELFVDGQRAGRGPERGDALNWFYESFDLDLAAGRHVIVARTWWLGQKTPAPVAQIMIRPGFLLAAEGDMGADLSTGVAPWECKELRGYEMAPSLRYQLPFVGCRYRLKGGQWDDGVERGEGDGWGPAENIVQGVTGRIALEQHDLTWMLRPAMLPAMLEQAVRPGKVRYVQNITADVPDELPIRKSDHLSSEGDAWSALLRGNSPLTIPANTRRRVLIDLENYFCAYPQLQMSGGNGSVVRVGWGESLFRDPVSRKSLVKNNRNEIEGKYFEGLQDFFEPGTTETMAPLWWQAGRYVELFITTAAAPLVIRDFHLLETHYQFEFAEKFEASDVRLAQLMPLFHRVLEMCAHETYMDCPYYEQLMYAGDTRLEALETLATVKDDCLPRKAVLMFDLSRRNSGLTMSRYPTHIPQMIPPFSLWWIAMTHDLAMWRDDPGFIRDRLRGVRCVVDAYLSHLNSDGLIGPVEGWNFVDWVPGWENGCSPASNRGISGIINLHVAYALRHAADLEDYVGEPELAARDRQWSAKIIAAVEVHFWDESRRLFADDMDRKHFTEHAQCLWLLCAKRDDPKWNRVGAALFADEGLARTTIYFSHYLFEACRLMGRIDRIFARMEETWFGLPALGFKTTLEMPEPSRSDCHAWGAHPMFHYFATILGIRPAAMGFKKIRIEPQLGPLAWARGTMPHPKGMITVELAMKNGALDGVVESPDGVATEVITGRQHRIYAGGRHSL